MSLIKTILSNYKYISEITIKSPIKSYYLKQGISEIKYIHNINKKELELKFNNGTNLIINDNEGSLSLNGEIIHNKDFTFSFKESDIKISHSQHNFY